MRIFLVGFIFVWTIANSSAVLAQDLYFAGFSFIGDATEDSNYPVAAKLFKEDSQQLNKQLKEALKKLKRNDLNLIYDQGLLKKGNAVALAYGLQKESSAVFRVEEGYETNLEITGEIYVFDYSDQEHKLIANFPTGYSITVQSKEKLTSKEISAYFENMYVPGKNKNLLNIIGSGKSQISVFERWVSILDNAKIDRAKKDLRLQIRDVVLDDAVVKQLPTNSDYIKDKRMLISETARNFERNLSANQNVPVLPYSVGRALGKDMLARFSDTNYTIKIPEADYVIDILVREFKKAKIEHRSYDDNVFAAFVTLRVSIPIAEKVLLESKFSYKDDKYKLPKGLIVIDDDWPFWMGAQKELFSILSKQVSVKDDKELSKITNNIGEVKPMLKTFDEVIAACR